jgi:hypothetical protein
VILGWELDFFGRVRREIESRDADAQALAADLRTLQVAIAAEVARTYVGLRGVQEQLEVARRNAETQAETLHLVDSGLAAGRGTEFDTARARAQLETTAARIPALEAEIAVAQHRLAVLAGEQPGLLSAGLDSAKPLPALPPTIDPGTPGELLRRRPDIAGAEARLHAATARVGVATADLYPRFTLSGLLGTRRRSAPRCSEATARAASSRSASTGRSSTRAGCTPGSQPRMRCPRKAWLDTGRPCCARSRRPRMRWSATARRASRTSTSRARRTKGRTPPRSRRTRFEAGAGTLLEVLDAERVQLQAQDALAGGRTRTLAGLIEVYRAVAGGWPARAPLAQRAPGPQASSTPLVVKRIVSYRPFRGFRPIGLHCRRLTARPARIPPCSLRARGAAAPRCARYRGGRVGNRVIPPWHQPVNLASAVWRSCCGKAGDREARPSRRGRPAP